MCLSLTSLQHWSRNAIVVRFVYRALKYLVTNLGGNKTKRRNTQSHFFLSVTWWRQFGLKKNWIHWQYRESRTVCLIKKAIHCWSTWLRKWSLTLVGNSWMIKKPHGDLAVTKQVSCNYDANLLHKFKVTLKQATDSEKDIE